jgi:hypothetical protein
MPGRSHLVAKDGAKKEKKKGKGERYLGPATVVKPALMGAGALFVIQGAMKMFLHA